MSAVFDSFGGVEPLLLRVPTETHPNPGACDVTADRVSLVERRQWSVPTMRHWAIADAARQPDLDSQG